MGMSIQPSTRCPTCNSALRYYSYDGGRWVCLKDGGHYVKKSNGKLKRVTPSGKKWKE